jgi:hypothetical protein
MASGFTLSGAVQYQLQNVRLQTSEMVKLFSQMIIALHKEKGHNIKKGETLSCYCKSCIFFLPISK